MTRPRGALLSVEELERRRRRVALVGSRGWSATDAPWKVLAKQVVRLRQDQSQRVTVLAAERCAGPQVHTELVCRERLALRRREMEKLETRSWRWVGVIAVLGTTLVTATWWRHRTDER